MAKLFLANQETFFDQSPDEALRSGMNAVENMNVPPVRLRLKAFEIIIAFCALVSLVPEAIAARDIYLAVRQDGHRGIRLGAGSLRCEFCGQIRCDSGALSRRY